MGMILERIYKIVETKGGLPGRLKLAQETGITMQQAITMRDKIMTVKQFKKAASKILGTDINELLE